MQKENPPRLSLKEYLDGCDKLLSDIADRMEDLDHLLHDRNSLHYAIDFSEVHAYTRTDDSRDLIEVFPGEENHLKRVLNEQLLEFMFFGIDTPMLLLPPYLTELERYFEYLKSRRGKEIAKTVNIPHQIERSKADKSLGELVALMERLRREGRGANESEAKRANIILRRYSSVLSIGNLHQLKSEMERLNHILQRHRFITLDEFLHKLGMPDIPEPDSTDVDFWFERIRKNRVSKRDLNDYADGLAIAWLRLVNQRLPQGQALRLISRSEAMHRVLTKRDLLRHPRVFLSCLSSTEAGLEDQKRSLDNLRAWLDAFVLAAKQAIEPHAGSDDSELMKHLARIREQWLEISQLRLTQRLSEEKVMQAGTELARGHIRGNHFNALKLLENPELLRSALRDVISAVSDSIKFEQTIAGFLIASRKAGEQRSNDVDIETRNRAVVLSSGRTSMPYTLEFYCPALRGNGLHTRRHQESLKALIRSASPEDAYERLLALAYYFAIYGYWEEAERYCRVALRESVRDESVQHEGHYFLAVCLGRAPHPSIDRHLEALAQLEKAADLKRKILNDGSKHEDDPRFLKEQATHIFLMHESFPGQVDSPDINKAVELSTRALELAEQTGDESLALQLVNNLCYYYCNQNDAALWRQVRPWYERLIVGLKRYRDKKRPVPPHLVDTQVWTLWRLDSAKLGPSERSGMAKQLEKVLDDSDLAPSARPRVTSHLRTIGRIG